MIFRSIFIATGLLWLVSCSHTTGYEQQSEAIGTVTAAEGVPTLTRRARPYMLGKQSQLFRGDILRTDPGSSLEVSLISGSRFTLAPRSELHIETFSSNGTEWLLRFTLASGAMEVSSQSIDERLTIRTNIALLTTRQPNLWVGYSAGYQRLDVVSLGQSEILVNNPDGKTWLSAPMEACAIVPGAAPRPKTVWSETRLQATRQTFNRLHHPAP